MVGACGVYNCKIAKKKLSCFFVLCTYYNIAHSYNILYLLVNIDNINISQVSTLHT